MPIQSSSGRAATDRKPALGTMPGDDPLWNTFVEDYLPPDGGTLRDHWHMLKLSKDRQILILNGSVGRRQRYRDLIFAILLKLMRRRTPVLMQDATWEPTSHALAREFPWLRSLLPKLARLAIRALDAPNVRYAVLSTSEVKTFPQVWGVDPGRVVFQPFPNTLREYEDMPTRDDGYLFAGGNSVRDYDLLEAALEGTDVATRIAASWQPQRGLAHLQARSTSHEEFMSLLANCRAMVVPLRPTVRSAGQQTYLNGMALGKPVIVVDAPGVRDYVIDGVTGVIVRHDLGQLRAAIRHVMDPANAAHYRAMGVRARADVLARFTETQFRHGLLMHAGMISQEQFRQGVQPASAASAAPLEVEPGLAATGGAS